MVTKAKTTRKPRSLEPEPTDPRVITAGRHLKQLRESQDLTQRQVMQKALPKRITNQQISRIEKGQIDKVPMRDLVTYGSILGLSPNEMAALYGYWDSSLDETAARDIPELIAVRALYRTLTERGQSQLRHDLEFVLRRKDDYEKAS